VKYIVFERKVGSLTHQFPVIFPKDLIHERVSQALTVMMRKTHKQEIKPIAAGEVNLVMTGMECGGSSETLGLQSRGQVDTVLIRMSDYGGGWS